MKAPEPEALRLAAEWLRQYDDAHDGGVDMARCAEVADWLDAQAEAADLRSVAREHGVSVSQLRLAMKAERPAG